MNSPKLTNSPKLSNNSILKNSGDSQSLLVTIAPIGKRPKISKPSYPVNMSNMINRANPKQKNGLKSWNSSTLTNGVIIRVHEWAVTSEREGEGSTKIQCVSPN